MKTKMGPVLSFRGCSDNNWNVSALVVTTEPPDKIGVLNGVLKEPNPEALWTTNYGTAYRYTFCFPMGDKHYIGKYSLDGVVYEVAIPKSGTEPRMAYATCNGFSSSTLEAKFKGNDPFCLWKAIAHKHGYLGSLKEEDINKWPKFEKSSPYHLLLLGGDQVYADKVLDPKNPLGEWNKKPWGEANRVIPSNKLQSTLDDFYFSIYVKHWAQPEIADIMARIPMIAMWDDHDLIDGWGSYPDERQDCPVYSALWNSASKAHAIFQQQLHASGIQSHPLSIGAQAAGWWQQPRTQSTRDGTFTLGCQVGAIAILAIDLRSQRTAEGRIIGEKHWNEIYKWIGNLSPDTCKHLVVMSSIPVIYPDFKLLENSLGIFPGHQDLEDDLRDHWNSGPHRGERTRFIKRLQELTRNSGNRIRITLVSGDVHIGALGIAQDLSQKSTGPDTIVNQLISSAIVHPDPGGLVLLALKALFDVDDQIDPYTIGKMIEIPEAKSKIIGSQNYLSIEPSETGGKVDLWCHWMTRGQKHPYTKVVHDIS